MPRLNIEDSFWSDRRFLRLCALTGDEMLAVGATIIAWKEAQKHWLDGHKPIPKECWENMPQASILEQAGWVKKVPEGVYIFGTEKAFQWWHEKCEAGRIGGRVSAQRERDAAGHFKPNQTQAEPKQTPSKTKQTQSSASASASASMGTMCAPSEPTTPLVDEPSLLNKGTKQPGTVGTQLFEMFARHWEVRYGSKPARTAQDAKHAKDLAEALADRFHEAEAILARYVKDGRPYYLKIRHALHGLVRDLNVHLIEDPIEKQEREFAEKLAEMDRKQRIKHGRNV